MARKGRFGRLPRTSPDLTATIVSMVREYQNMRDRNIVNAWEKGGEFEGKPATDERLMAHLKMRRDEVSKDDPLYDEYSQRVYEYDFAIANSKQELAYAEGKVNDTQMSQFYRKWAGKLPKNSEAWRNNMTLAAQYKDRAAQAGRGRGGGGGGGGYNSLLNRFPSDKENTYDRLLDTLTEVARSLGVLNDDKETLGDLRALEGDATLLITVIDKFNNDPFFADEKAEAVAYIQKWGNPNFQGDITFDILNSEKINKDAGLRDRLAKAQKAGHKGDIKAILKEIEKVDEAYMEATAAGPLAQYEAYRKQFDLVKNDPTATPIDLYLAYDKYAKQLTNLDQYTSAMYGAIASSPSVGTMQGHLRNEIAALMGQDINQPNLMDDSRGESTANSGETAQMAAVKRELDAGMVLLGTGMGVITRTDDAGQPSATGTSYDVVPLTALTQFGQNIVMVPANGTAKTVVNIGGVEMDFSAVMTAVIPTPVNVTGTAGALDRMGNPEVTGVAPKGSAQAANIYDMPGGTKLIQYAMPDGSKRFSNAETIFEGPDGQPLPVNKDSSGNYTVTYPMAVAGSNWSAFAAIDPDYLDPYKTSVMPNTVATTSYTAWVSAQRTMRSDPGVAYALDPEAVRLSIQSDLPHVDPSTYAGLQTLNAAYREGEQARVDYLQNTKNVDVRMRRAAELDRTVTAADVAAIDEGRATGYADLAGLQRDVSEYYTRLGSGQILSQDAAARLGERGQSSAGIQAEKDRLMREMLLGGDEESRLAESNRMRWTVQAEALGRAYGKPAPNNDAFFAKLSRGRKTGIVGSGRGASPSTLTYGGSEKVKPGMDIRDLLQFPGGAPVPAYLGDRSSKSAWGQRPQTGSRGTGGYPGFKSPTAPSAPKVYPALTGPAAGPTAPPPIPPPNFNNWANVQSTPQYNPGRLAANYVPPKPTLNLSNIPKAKLDQLKLL